MDALVSAHATQTAQAAAVAERARVNAANAASAAAASAPNNGNGSQDLEQFMRKEQVGRVERDGKRRGKRQETRGVRDFPRGARTCLQTLMCLGIVHRLLDVSHVCCLPSLCLYFVGGSFTRRVYILVVQLSINSPPSLTHIPNPITRTL